MVAACGDSTTADNYSQYTLDSRLVLASGYAPNGAWRAFGNAQSVAVNAVFGFLRGVQPMKVAIVLVVTALIFGCSKPPNPTGFVSRDVKVPGRFVLRVVYAGQSNEDCVAISKRADEVLRAPQTELQSSGLSSRDVKGLSPFRAYFHPSQLVDESDAAFVFCNGQNAAFVPVQCRLLGVTERGCFQAGIHGVADAEGIKSTIQAIRANWPNVL